MYIKAALMILTVVLQSKSTNALECFSCSSITNIPDCLTTVSCPANYACSSKYETHQGHRLYTLGCQSISTCPANSTGGTFIVGRSTTGDGTCSECCSTGNCNRQLCQNADASCSDDPDRDCVATGDSFNICGDISHARQYCRKFCGFCNTVDGGWAEWTTWSACDVTCANGTRSRSRACTNPPPANGGKDCIGGAMASEICAKPLCPVHGGWAMWSQWGACSVTCDIGLRRRDRTCSNPYPARQGDHCFGDSRDDSICSPRPCSNGGWSLWGTWGSCDKTCDGGVRTRTRTCDNPVPSLTGKGCPGETTKVESCNTSPCQGPVVFFAKDLYSLSPGQNAALRFIHVTTNVGNGYSSANGIFTAPVGGTYTFNVQFCTYSGKFAGVGLFINGVRYQNLITYNYNSYTCRTLSVSVLLKQGDKVNAKTDSETYTGVAFYTNDNRINSFSGALVLRI